MEGVTDYNSIYTERANRKLEHLCVTRYYDKYPTGAGIADAYKQMEKELSYIEQQKSAPLVIEAYEALTAVEAKAKDFCIKGALGASVVLHIMGITEIEPLSISPKVYPEFCFGLDGEKKLALELFVTNKLYEKLVRYFDNYTGEARVRHKHFSNGALHGVRISDPNRSIGVNDSLEFSFLFTPVASYKTFGKSITTGQPFDELKPETFDEQVKCMCWKSFDNGTWEGNGRELYRAGSAKLEELIANREDLFEYLMLHGIDKKTAFDLTQDIIFGRVCRNGWNEEIRELLNHANIPEWYIHSLEKIRGLSSRMHAITMLKHFGPRVGKGQPSTSYTY